MTQLKFDLTLFKSLQCLEVSLLPQSGCMKNFLRSILVRSEIPKDDHVFFRTYRHNTLIDGMLIIKIISWLYIDWACFWPVITDFQTISSLLFFPKSRLMLNVVWWPWHYVDAANRASLIWQRISKYTVDLIEYIFDLMICICCVFNVILVGDKCPIKCLSNKSTREKIHEIIFI